MKNLYNMYEWVFEKKTKISDLQADLNISFVYPDMKELLKFKPKDRVKTTDKLFKNHLKSLLKLNLVEDYSLNGTKKRPLGINTKSKLKILIALNKLNFVNVHINAIENVEKVRVSMPPVEKYFCVKMTVTIDIEGIKSKKQAIETRFVLVKAISFDDAYHKVENGAEDYATPYLNTAGRLVRWQYDSMDDCFETNISDLNELNNSEGVEVYSKLKSRKRRKPHGTF